VSKCCKRFKDKGRPCDDCKVVNKLPKKKRKKFLALWEERCAA